jgi:hypothetical protein
MAKHVRRSRLVWPARGAAAGATLFVTGVFIGQAGAAPLGSVVPVPDPAVDIGSPIQVTRDDPVPHLPPVRVAKVLSPCSAKRAQLTATEVELRSVYRTATALELAEDAGVIASAIAAQCGWWEAR